jgi:hypothetical protein
MSFGPWAWKDDYVPPLINLTLVDYIRNYAELFFFFLSAWKTTKLKTNKEDEESLSKLGGREQTGKEIRKKG